MDFISNKNKRTALTRFRLSSHDLAIKSGRYDDTPRSDRLYKFCKLNVVENEFNFFFVVLCILITETIFQFLLLPLANFENLMSVKSERKIKYLAKYVYFASQLRIATNLD